MPFFKTIKQKNADLFVYQPADEVHLHDRLLDKFIIRFLPDSVTPNQITLLRVILTPFVFFLVLNFHYKTGVVLFLLAAFTDAIDGSLARTRNQITKFGMLFDPLADKLLIGSMVFLVVFRHFGVWLGISILSLEIIFIVSALWARLRFKTVRMANIWGKIKMQAQVFATGITMIAILNNQPSLLPIAYWLFGLSVGLAIISLFKHGV
ncbi:MAG: CDP-alcohol phosphatidyltransferase family protein [Patescibacteria group bacterium]